ANNTIALSRLWAKNSYNCLSTLWKILSQRRKTPLLNRCLCPQIILNKVVNDEFSNPDCPARPDRHCVWFGYWFQGRSQPRGCSPKKTIGSRSRPRAQAVWQAHFLGFNCGLYFGGTLVWLYL